MRKTITIKEEYFKVLDKILEHRPHLKTRTGAIERAIDHYLNEIIRLDLKKKEVYIKNG